MVCPIDSDDKSHSLFSLKGNDVVVLVFREPGAPPFDPTKIKSHFNHVFCLVEPDETKLEPHYKVAFACKSSLPPYGPALPNLVSFPRTERLRKLLLTKLINGERASNYIKEFRVRTLNSRKQLLQNITEKYPPEKKEKKGLLKRGKSQRDQPAALGKSGSGKK